MTKYVVYIPVTMSLAVEVDAESEEEAKDTAFNVDVIFQLMGSDKDSCKICECEFHEQVVRGNVFHGVRNELEVEEA
jgi:hypothetical protein